MRKILEKIKIWYEQHFGEYSPVREFDFVKAQDFYEAHKNELFNMAFCLGFDSDVWSPIMEDGVLIKSPICFSEVEGITRTFYDVPCFCYEFKSGSVGKMYCFKEYEYNKPSNTFRYLRILGVPQKRRCFGVYDARMFTDTFSKMYANITE